MSNTLVGNEGYSDLGDAIRAAAGLQNPGNDIVLTLNSKIQSTAEGVLKGLSGACTVLDTKTGAVLAQASAPGYDVNQVGDLLSGKKSSNNGELVNRCTASLYTPGSTFKTISLAGVLEDGKTTIDSQVSSPSSIELGGAPVTTHQDSGTISVKQAIAISSNTAFGQLSVDLGAKKLVDEAEKFGFNNDSIAQDFSVAKSLMPDPAEMTTWETAWAGCGQPVGEHASPAGPQATVTQMAVAMAAIANDGVAMKPYLVDHVLSSEGSTIATTSPAILNKVMSAKNAKAEQEALKYTVSQGTATAAQISGATVMGKTGTAEAGNNKEHAWFIATAEANGKSVTVAIVVENASDEGALVAAPKAKTVLETALKEVGGLK